MYMTIKYWPVPLVLFGVVEFVGGHFQFNDRMLTSVEFIIFHIFSCTTKKFKVRSERSATNTENI